MGSNPTQDSYAENNEQPQHTLSLPAFYMAKYPITNAQYATFLQRSGYKGQKEWQESLKTNNRFPVGSQPYPAVYVSWHDAVAFCQWFTEASGHLVRLPTEAEWEKAARGPEGRIYPWGNTFAKNKLNSEEGGVGTTTPVGSYSPQGDSPYGLVDMAGNVWEWCSTIWAEKAYPFFIQDEWQEDYLTQSGDRVVRGGSWDLNESYARSVVRVGGNPDDSYDFQGFRVVFPI